MGREVVAVSVTVNTVPISARLELLKPAVKFDGTVTVVIGKIVVTVVDDKVIVAMVYDGVERALVIATDDVVLVVTVEDGGIVYTVKVTVIIAVPTVVVLVGKIENPSFTLSVRVSMTRISLSYVTLR